MAGINGWGWRRWRLRHGLNSGWGEHMMAQLTEVGATGGVPMKECDWMFEG